MCVCGQIRVREVVGGGGGSGRKGGQKIVCNEGIMHPSHRNEGIMHPSHNLYDEDSDQHWLVQRLHSSQPFRNFPRVSLHILIASPNDWGNVCKRARLQVHVLPVVLDFIAKFANKMDTFCRQL